MNVNDKIIELVRKILTNHSSYRFLHSVYVPEKLLLLAQLHRTSVFNSLRRIVDSKERNQQLVTMVCNELEQLEKSLTINTLFTEAQKYNEQLTSFKELLTELSAHIPEFYQLNIPTANNSKAYRLFKDDILHRYNQFLRVFFGGKAVNKQIHDVVTEWYGHLIQINKKKTIEQLRKFELNPNEPTLLYEKILYYIRSTTTLQYGIQIAQVAFLVTQHGFAEMYLPISSLVMDNCDHTTLLAPNTEEREITVEFVNNKLSIKVTAPYHYKSAMIKNTEVLTASNTIVLHWPNGSMNPLISDIDFQVKLKKSDLPGLNTLKELDALKHDKDRLLHELNEQIRQSYSEITRSPSKKPRSQSSQQSTPIVISPQQQRSKHVVFY